MGIRKKFILFLKAYRALHGQAFHEYFRCRARFGSPFRLHCSATAVAAVPILYAGGQDFFELYNMQTQ